MIERATFAGGCFWCLEAVFDMLKGVHSATSGYAGGDPARADYKSVCNGDTCHAEVVRVEFDPAVISFRDLLAVYFAIHDPTSLNRQGADVGTQYRSAVFTESESQKTETEAFIADLAKTSPKPIVTQVGPLDAFFTAEDYHKQYYQRNPGQAYCLAVVGPKVAKARTQFAHLLKSSA
jgi:peptide-methionine (S)-S-oxide reductase